MSRKLLDVNSVQEIRSWPVDHAATAVVDIGGDVVAADGPQDRAFKLASVTKPLTAYAVLIAIEEGAITLDDPAGPPGSTVRHLLAHTSGLDFNRSISIAAAGTRRIYSNVGFAVLADAVQKATGIVFADYLREAVFEPLQMADTRLDGPAGSGGVSTCADLSRFARELLRPTLLDPMTLGEATHVVFPDRNGVVPGFGNQKPNDWGLGFEIRGHKTPHWTGSVNSAATYGHFGQAGTFIWVDPMVNLACIALTDRDFGPWAAEVWPAYSDSVLKEFGQTLR